MLLHDVDWMRNDYDDDWRCACDHSSQTPSRRRAVHDAARLTDCGRPCERRRLAQWLARNTYGELKCACNVLLSTDASAGWGQFTSCCAEEEHPLPGSLCPAVRRGGCTALPGSLLSSCAQRRSTLSQGHSVQLCAEEEHPLPGSTLSSCAQRRSTLSQGHSVQLCAEEEHPLPGSLCPAVRRGGAPSPRVTLSRQPEK